MIKALNLALGISPVNISKRNLYFGVGGWGDVVILHNAMNCNCLA